MKIDFDEVMRSKFLTPPEFVYENLSIPPLYHFMDNEDLSKLYNIATSAKLSSRMSDKRKFITEIMERRGFKYFAGGTNRMVFRFMEDTTFVAKVALDKVGLQDNPNEFNNQQFIRPFCTKTFYTSYCGSVGFAERVLPIVRLSEFREIAHLIFEMLYTQLIGKYVMEDIGTNYFKNYGLRKDFGPVLLDYPYIYELDGNRLFCNAADIQTGFTCEGEIDYDDGMNKLYCRKCGRRYLAKELAINVAENKVLMKKRSFQQMRVRVTDGENIIYQNDSKVTDLIRPDLRRAPKEPKKLVARINFHNEEETVETENNIADPAALEEFAGYDSSPDTDEEESVEEAVMTAEAAIETSKLVDRYHAEEVSESDTEDEVDAEEMPIEEGEDEESEEADLESVMTPYYITPQAEPSIPDHPPRHLSRPIERRIPRSEERNRYGGSHERDQY